MSTMNPNQTLLQGAHQSPSDKTPAALAGPSQVSTFESQNLPPPSPLYIQRDDVLFVVGNAQNAQTILTITVRLLLAGTNRIQTIQDTLIITTPYAFTNKTISLAEGYLLSVTVQNAVVSNLPSAFVSLAIVRGLSANLATQPGELLIQNYVGLNALVGWPGSQIINPIDGPGLRRTVIVGNPAAGADWSTSPGVGAQWEVVSFNATLTTSATVANRQIQVQIKGAGGATLFTGCALVNIAASLAAVVSGTQLAPTTSIIATDVPLPIPPRNRLQGPDTFGTLTAGIQAADQWSNIALEVIEWLVM